MNPPQGGKGKQITLEVKMPLLTSNTKIDKSVIWAQKQGLEFEAVILQMNPGKGVCVNWELCISDCIAFTGYGKFKNVRAGREKRKKLFLNDIEGFKKQLKKELTNLVKRAEKKGKIPVCRLNGFTDIDWGQKLQPDGRIIEVLFDGLTVFELFPEITFWDYSADYLKTLSNKIPNLHLTFSYKGNNLTHCWKLLYSGINIAVIDRLDTRQLFARNSFKQADFDTHDFRFLDKPGTIGWLKFKE
jgi:hypothetical protein